MSMKSLCTYGSCSTLIRSHCLHFRPKPLLRSRQWQLYKWRRCLQTSSKWLTITQNNERSPQESVVSKTHELKIGLDIVRPLDKEEMSLPAIIYMHSPLKYFMTKLNLLKLKMQWDYGFVESEFIDKSKQTAALITDLIRNNKTTSMMQLTTPMGYKQISHDMMGSTKDFRVKLLRFGAEHIRRAIPLKVSMMRHYGHKFAFIDMVFVCMRRSNDFNSEYDAKEVSYLINYLNYQPVTQTEPFTPIIFAEIFIRFRRDYSFLPVSPQELASGNNPQWLISNYKILQFDVIGDHPFLDIKPATTR